VSKKAPLIKQKYIMDDEYFSEEELSDSDSDSLSLQESTNETQFSNQYKNHQIETLKQLRKCLNENKILKHRLVIENELDKFTTADDYRTPNAIMLPLRDQSTSTLAETTTTTTATTTNHLNNNTAAASKPVIQTPKQNNNLISTSLEVESKEETSRKVVINTHTDGIFKSLKHDKSVQVNMTKSLNGPGGGGGDVKAGKKKEEADNSKMLIVENVVEEVASPVKQPPAPVRMMNSQKVDLHETACQTEENYADKEKILELNGIVESQKQKFERDLKSIQIKCDEAQNKVITNRYLQYIK
jgi:hypothetical protein